MIPFFQSSELVIPPVGQDSVADLLKSVSLQPMLAATDLALPGCVVAAAGSLHSAAPSVIFSRKIKLGLRYHEQM